MKKYIITGVVGLAAVAVAGWFMLQGKFLTNNGTLTQSDNVFEFLPTTFDQLLYFSFDEELRAAMEKIDTTTGNASFQSLAEAVDKLVVIQSTDPENPLSLMFLVNEKPVDIASLQQAGLIASDPSYITEQLASNVWVYGDTGAVHSYDATFKKGALLSSEKALSTRAADVIADKYNVGMFSYAASAPSVSPLASKFINALRWTAVSSHLGQENAFGNVTMQFSGDIIPEAKEDFVPELSDYPPDTKVAYVEIANLINLFGIDQEQFTTVASLFFNQFGGGSYSALLSNDDYAKLYKGFSSHLAITIAPSTGSLLGLGAQIIVGNPDIFSVLKTLGPIWKGMVGGLSGAANVKVYSDDNLIRYTSPEIPYSLLGQKIEIIKDSDVTRFVVGDIPTTRGPADDIVSFGGAKYTYDAHTIATFIVDTKQLQQVMAATEGIAPGLPQLGVGSYLKGGTVIGNLSANSADNQLSLSFTVK